VATRLVLPRLYVIIDAALLTLPPPDCAQELAEAGVRLVQYRNKTGSARELLKTSRQLSTILAARGVSFLVNDRPDVALLADAKGVHVGQDDLDVEQTRSLVGTGKWVGISTHNLSQFHGAVASSADYVAVGPIFATSSKGNPDPVIGVDFIRRVRGLTDKPIVAIGGITRDNAASIIKAGADCVAVIRDIAGASHPGQRARQFLELLEAANHAPAY
jgi:thiamine-phosphate pyrophosphorylase